jgi:hypothetical protein
MKTRFLSRSAAVLAAMAVAALVGAGAAAASPPPVHVSAGCTGDNVTGSVQLKKGGAWPVTVSLLSESAPSRGFVPASQKALSTSGSQASFSFDISELNAFAYRVDAAGVQGRVIPAASCAPGHQVPEAPAAVLLPLGLLLLGLGVAARNRRGRRAVV